MAAEITEASPVTSPNGPAAGLARLAAGLIYTGHLG